MHVLLLTHYFEPENGAPQRRWQQLISRFTEAGHSVSVIAPSPHYPSGRKQPEHYGLYRPGTSATGEHGGKVYRVGWLPHRGDIVSRSVDHCFTAFQAYRTAARLINRGRIRPDVVVATAPAVETLVAGHLLSHRYGLPLVCEMRDAWPDLVTYTPTLQRDGGVVGQIKGLIHGAITRMQRRSAEVVTTTREFARVLESRGLEHVHVVRNGTLPEVFEQVPPRSTGHGELRALYMGNLGRSQGLDVVIRAAHNLQLLGLPVSVRLVGTGHARRSLISLNERLGGPVEILPSVAPAEVVEHYRWADTTIVSLRPWEPFAWTIPSKLYELLASGRHITGLLAGESAELLAETGAGDLVTPGDVAGLVALWQELLANPERLEIGDGGRVWVREHAAYDALAERYLELLSGVLPTGESAKERGGRH